MERFARLQDIAEGVADRIREIGDFKLVTYAQATNGEQVWKMLQAMTNLPVAIVAIGTADFDEEALKRQIHNRRGDIFRHLYHCDTVLLAVNCGHGHIHRSHLFPIRAAQQEIYF